jgi:hypothetical protein
MIMKKTSLTIFVIFFVVLSGFVTGCRKENELLGQKPNEALNTLSTLQDLQLLLKNESIFNNLYPALGESSTDDFYFDYSTWLNIYGAEKNAYIWAKDIYTIDDIGEDWYAPYQMIFYANTILDALPKIKVANGQSAQSDQIKGSALFFRSVAFYNLLQEFAPQYVKSSASSDLGVPLPLTPDLKAKLPRSTVEVCYEQIISDLKIAIELLPDLPEVKTLPSRAASLALLSRIYLIMADYSNSLDYATQALKINSVLQDFNQLDPTAAPMYPNYSPEELFHAGVGSNYTSSTYAQADTLLLQSYDDPNDLRLLIYFEKLGDLTTFNSQRDKQNNLSYSFTTAELLLNKSECEARAGDAAKAISDLNTLLKTRWKTGTYVPLVSNDASLALVSILKERRKELVMTTLRWSDLRRLNIETKFEKTLTRVMNGITYTLPPKDPRYILPIPQNEIRYNSIPQNNR